LEWLQELGEAIWGWFGVEDHRDRLESILTAVGVLGSLIIALAGGAFWLVKWLRKKPEEKEQSDEPVNTKLDVASFLAIQGKLKADLEKELTTAHQDEKAELTARIAELENQIANPDAALAEAQERIKDLETRLERMGNDIGGDRLAAARAAFQKLDYSVADDIFAEIEDRQKLQVQQAARAALGRGEVAEAELRWHDAAEHYVRAARLDPSYDTLFNAGLLL